jgi:hypothetical protein
MRDNWFGVNNHHARAIGRRHVVALLSGTGLVASNSRLSAQPVDLAIRVELSEDRNQTGVLFLLNSAGKKIAGPFPAFGRSDNTQAAAHGNLMDPMEPWCCGRPADKR